MSMKVSKYNEFILEKKFNDIIDDILLIVESDGRWLNDNTIEWDLTKRVDDEPSPTFEWDFDDVNKTKSRLSKFLSKLPKEKIKKYFFKLLNKIKDKPLSLKRKVFLPLSIVFFSFLPFKEIVNYEKDIDKEEKVDKKLDIDFIIKSNNDILFEVYKKTRKSSFDIAQSFVKGVEKGYSDDKKDRGNYIGDEFIGTNHGISAIVLMEYLKRKPTIEDMKGLTYQTALNILKKKYWDAQNLHLFNNQSVANILYDGCVNHGIGAMKKILKASYRENGIQIGNDNPFSEKYIKLANDLDEEKLFNSIKKSRELKYRRSGTFKDHGKGWLERLDSIEFEEIKFEEFQSLF